MADCVPAKILKYQKMSDHIPFEIQEDIIKRLPVKSLVRFRSVSKPWNSLISSSEFIANYHVNNPQPQRIFVSYFDSEEKYVSSVDDNTFPHNKFFHAVPVSVNQLEGPFYNSENIEDFHSPFHEIGSSQGLFCFYRYSTGKPSISKTAVIWNPSVRKSVVVSVPNILDELTRTVVGFVVCPVTKDPKLVKFTYFIDCSMPWQVEIYTVSSGVWRTPLCSNIPSDTMDLKGEMEVIDGVIYCLSCEWFIDDRADQYYNHIISFDMISEEFTIINSDCLPWKPNITYTMSKLRESLVLLAYDKWEKVKKVYEVWMMEPGVTKSFTKLFTIDPPHGSIERVIGFRKSGEAIIEMKSDYDKSDDSQNSLFVYDPYSGNIDSMGISGKAKSFFVNSYTETLLLLDH